MKKKQMPTPKPAEVKIQKKANAPKAKLAQKTISTKAAKPKRDYSTLLWCLGIVLLTFVVFAPVLGFDFVNWDDDRYVTDNPFLKELTTGNILVYFKQFYFLMYLPLTMLTYVLDAAIAGGLKPWMFHLTSLILHLFNTAMVFMVVFRLEAILRGKKDWLMPAVVAVLFGIVASHVESVAWVAERKDVLYTAFVLVSFYAYLIYHDTKQRKYYWLSLLVFVCSLLSKAQAFPFAFILFFVDGLLLGTYFNKQRWLEKIPFFVVALFFAALAVIGNKSDPEAFQELDYSFVERLSFAAYGYVVYVVKLFVPFKLSIIQPYPEKVNGTVPFLYWLFVFPVLVVVGLFVYMFKKNQRVVFGIAFYSFSIVIVLQLFAYHNFLMAERYSYVSSIGVFYLLAYGLYELVLSNPKVRILVLSLLAVYVGAMCFITTERLSKWKDSIAMWDDVVEKYPQVIIAYYNEANYKADKGDLKGAMVCYNKALDLNPDYIPALSNRGVTKGKINDPKGALEDFMHVARLDQNYKNVYSNLGNANAMLGDMQAAIKSYDKALLLKPDFTDALFNRAHVKSVLGNLEAAVEDYNKLLRLDNNFKMGHHARGMALVNISKPKEAISDFNYEIQLNPNNMDSKYGRAVCYLRLKQNDLALSDLNQLIQASPKQPLTYYQRAFVYLGKSMNNQACADFKQAVQLGYAQAQQDLERYCK